MSGKTLENQSPWSRSLLLFSDSMTKKLYADCIDILSVEWQKVIEFYGHYFVSWIAKGLLYLIRIGSFETMRSFSPPQ